MRSAESARAVVPCGSPTVTPGSARGPGSPRMSGRPPGPARSRRPRRPARPTSCRTRAPPRRCRSRPRSTSGRSSGGRRREGGLELGRVVGRAHLGSQARCVRREVDGQHVPGELAGGRVAVPEVLERPHAAALARQVADASEPVVVEQHDRQRDPLLDRGHQLRGQHQPRAVTDHHEHPPAGLGHRDADAPRDLVAHRRVAVLEVVAAGPRRAPQLVEVARQAARGAHHDAVLSRCLVDQPDRLGLRDMRRRPEATHPVHLGDPRGPEAVLVRPLFRGDTGPAARLECGCQLLERDPRIPDERDGPSLRGVETGDVDGHEPHLGVLPGRPAGGREVRQPGAHGDDEVRIARDGVARRPAGRADRAHLERMVPGDGALPRLGLRDGDAEARRERVERRLGTRVEHAAAAHDHGPPRGGDGRRGAGEEPRVRADAGHHPRALLEHVARGSPMPPPERPGAARASRRPSRTAR